MNEILLTEFLILKATKHHQGVNLLEQPPVLVAITST